MFGLWLLFLGVFQLVLNLLILWLEFRRASCSVFLWGCLLLMFGFPHFLTSINPDGGYRLSVYAEASLFAIAFMVIYLLVRFLLDKTAGKYNLVESLDRAYLEHTKNETKMEWFFLFLLLLSFAVVVVFVKRVTGNIFDASWGGIFSAMESRYKISSLSGFLFNFTPTFNIIASGILISLLLEKHYLRALPIIAILLLGAVIVGEKARFLNFIIPVVIVVFIKNRKLTATSLLKYAVLVLGGFVCVCIMAYMRSYTISSFISNFDLKALISYVTNVFDNMGGELGLREVFYYFIENNNNFPGFNTGAGYLRVLLWWLPTGFSFGLKPPDFAVTMGSALLGYEQTAFSTHPTLFGDCYANFHWFGIILGVFWAAFVYFFEKFIYSRSNYMVRAAIASALAQMYIMMARGSVYNSIYSVFLSTVFVCMANFALCRVKWRIS